MDRKPRDESLEENFHFLFGEDNEKGTTVLKVPVPQAD
jgi:hypothetical protein